jgi:glycine oxidase
MRKASKSRARRAVRAGPDVVIIGGGVMGCACAWELARAGRRVVVLERSVPGAEASSAAAGILGAQAEAHAPGPMTELSLLSRSRYAAWAEALARATSIDVGYRECGLMRVDFDRKKAAELARGAHWQRGARLGVERIDAPRALSLEPKLSTRVVGGVRFADDARVDPRLLLKALHVAALRAGASFRTGAYVGRVLVQREHASGVVLSDGTRVAAEHVVVAAGSWSSLVEGAGIEAGAVRPARGQIVELASAAPLLRHVVFGPRCYLVPRDDGRTLVGSTLEFVGYRRDVTARAVRDLLSAALELVPELASASLGRSWSSFRPYTEDELPLIGSSGIAGLSLATGHYRNGILLAPITAEIVRCLVENAPPPLPLAAFDPRRRKVQS